MKKKLKRLIELEKYFDEYEEIDSEENKPLWDELTRLRQELSELTHNIDNMKPVIYVHGQLLKSSSVIAKALKYVDESKRLSKTEMRRYLKGIFNHIHSAISAK